MGKKIDLSIIGEVFGDLRVISFSHKEKGKSSYWNCFCSVCKEVAVIERNNILSGNNSSCGCRRRFGGGRKVAELAGVSQSAVSQILNNKSIEDYRPEVVAKVRSAAREVGYRPWYRRMY